MTDKSKPDDKQSTTKKAHTLKSPSKPNLAHRPSFTKLWATDLLRRGRISKPITAENGLSIAESYFYHGPAENKPQVIMSIWCRLKMPQNTPLSVTRLVDVVKLAAAEHFRLVSFVDPDTNTFHPLGDFASEFNPLVKVVERKGTERTWESVLRKELNTNFNLKQEKTPLWKVAIVVSPKVVQAYRREMEVTRQRLSVTGAGPDNTGELEDTTGTAVDSTVTTSENAPETAVENNDTENSVENHIKHLTVTGSVESVISPSLLTPANGKPPANSSTDQEIFEVAFSFHHCLGDGLSMWAFGRTFLKYASREYFTDTDLKLNSIPLSITPPPILDNLMNPSLLEVLPAALSMIFGNVFKKRHKRYKGRKGDQQDQEEEEEVDENAISSFEPLSPLIESIPDLTLVTDGTKLKPPPNARLTSTRFFFYDTEFVSSLRKKSKQEGTTIAALLVVNALAAVRTAFSDLPKYKKKKFPARQGWVITNSMRHLLPNSKLMYGADKQTDPAVSVFGGYAGSVANANLKLTDSNDFWERCRTVRRGIISNFRTSLTRLKMANYLYRRPKLFNFIKNRVQLDKLSRQFSVELANLGAWDCPTANQDSPPDDPRLRLEQFGGIINSSFDGARGLFTLGVITLGGSMSVMIAYDKTAVSENDANRFAKAFDIGMKTVKQSVGKVSILQARTGQL